MINWHRHMHLYSALFHRGILMREQGYMFIEVIVAVAIIGLAAIALLTGFSTSFGSVGVMDRKSAGENLARAQMEYIQQQPYDSGNVTPIYNILPDIPTGYSIVTPLATRLDPKGDGTDNDDGLQKITVLVQCHGETIFKLEDYKVQR